MNEGMLDIGATVSAVTSAAEIEAARGWLVDHGTTSLQYADPDKVMKDGKWMLMGKGRGASRMMLDKHRGHITLTGKEDIPDFVKIDSLYTIVFSKWMGAKLPDISGINIDTIIIRNCPNLTSLEGCPEQVAVFSVSDCPKLDSLEGCPKVASHMFKFYHCGIQEEPRKMVKIISKACKTPRANMIF